jgi:hypothetical protein
LLWSLQFAAPHRVFSSDRHDSQCLSARDAFLGAPAARLLSSLPVSLVSTPCPRRLMDNKVYASGTRSTRDTGNLDGDRQRALRYASSLETLGIWPCTANVVRVSPGSVHPLQSKWPAKGCRPQRDDHVTVMVEGIHRKCRCVRGMFLAGSPQEQAGPLGEMSTEGAPAVAVRISGVSRRSVYRSAPVMEAREDLHWRRETPEISDNRRAAAAPRNAS